MPNCEVTEEHEGSVTESEELKEAERMAIGFGKESFRKKAGDWAKQDKGAER